MVPEVRLERTSEFCREIEDIAEYFEISPERIIQEINSLGEMINRVGSNKTGYVYIKATDFAKSGEEDRLIDFITNRRGLFEIGLLAYYSWQKDNTYELRFYRDGKDERWAPGHFYTMEEVLLPSKRTYDQKGEYELIEHELSRHRKNREYPRKIHRGSV